MKKLIVAVAVMFIFSGAAYAGCSCGQRSGANLGKNVASTVTDTGKAAAEGTAKVAQTSVGNTVEAPKAALEATRDTAGTALERADEALKTLTGEEK